jgi:hypothetical protein
MSTMPVGSYDDTAAQFRMPYDYRKYADQSMKMRASNARLFGYE